MGSPKLLLEASCSYRPNGEDRLTEIFASTLNSHPGLLNNFASRLGLPNAAYQLTTQHWGYDGVTRIDMRLSAHHERREIAVAYVENKIDGYWFSDSQIQRERNCLNNEHASEKVLACIVTRAEMDRLSDPDAAASGLACASDFDVPLTWGAVAELAKSAGCSWPEPWGGADWQQTALRPEAPAAQRVLHEFLTYLPEGGMPDPVSLDHMRAFSSADKAIELIEGLLEDAAYSAKPWDPTLYSSRGNRIVYIDAESSTDLRCVDFTPPPQHAGHWASDDENVGITVAIDPGLPGLHPPESGPILHAGLYLIRDLAESARTDPTWLQDAAKLGFTPIDYPSGLWPCRTALLSAVTEGPSYEEQINSLGYWIREALDAVLSLGPPSSD